MDKIDKQLFDYSKRDERRWLELDGLIKKLNLPLKDVLMNFQAFSRRRDIVRFLSHYEIFKETINLPGVVMELGVSKGTSLLTWAHLMETFCPGDRTKKVYGFDHFEGLVDFQDEDGKVNTNDKAGKHIGGWKAPKELPEKLCELFNEDTFVPNINRVELIEGDIFDTLPKFIENNPGLRISLLHLDVDLYRASKFALEKLFPLVVKGGAIVFDEYGLIPWEGEAKAVDEYFKEINYEPKILKHRFTVTPSGYFFK